MFNLRLSFIVGGLIICFGVLQYRLWFESAGLRDMSKLRKLLAQQEKENNQLKKRNEDLVFQIKGLQNTDEAVEYRARSELDMIKKNETFYQIVKENK